MDKRQIICISREFGSGGRQVATLLAEKLGIPCYDKALLELTAREHGLSQQIVETVDEQPVSWTAMGFPMGLRNPYKADFSDAMHYVINDRIFHWTAETIRHVAAQGSCVIVGRVAEEVLRGDPDVCSVFIHAKSEDRVRRIMAGEQVDEATAARLMRKNDKNRANYHNFYSSRKWGECASYDLSISTSAFGIEGAVRQIITALNGFGAKAAD
jgi:cytidylate kinase